MRERDLCVHVARWLRGLGFAVHGEVELPNSHALGYEGGRRHDLVGVTDAEVVVVEAKKGYTKDVREQARLAAMHADRVWIAIPHRKSPPSLSLSPLGARPGLLLVSPNGWVVEHWRPCRRDDARPSVLRAALTVFTLDRPGGLCSSEGGASRSAWQCRAWELHRVLWLAGPTFLGDLLPMVLQRFEHIKIPRRALHRMLCVFPFFRQDKDGRWEATGDGVPPEAAPGLPPPEPVEQICFPRRRVGSLARSSKAAKRADRRSRRAAKRARLA